MSEDFLYQAQQLNNQIQDYNDDIFNLTLRAINMCLINNSRSKTLAHFGLPIPPLPLIGEGHVLVDEE